MKRVVIVGNGGSGKSYLGQKVSEVLSSEYISLDDLFWEPGRFDAKRSPEAVEQDINHLKTQESWVVEGVFGGMAEQFIPYAGLFIFLDIDWDVCKASMLSRTKPGQTEETLSELITWCAAYYTRDNKNSYKHHEQLFNTFSGHKLKFPDREAINRWLKSLA